MIEFTCACGQKQKVKDEYAGKKGRCKNCGASLQIRVAGTGSEGQCAKMQLNKVTPSGDRQFAEEPAKKSHENEKEEDEPEKINEELQDSEVRPVKSDKATGNKPKFGTVAIGLVSVIVIAVLIVEFGTKKGTISGAAWITKKAGQSDILRGFEITLCKVSVIQDINKLQETEIALFAFWLARFEQAKETGDTTSMRECLKHLSKYGCLNLVLRRDASLKHALTTVRTDVEGKYTIPAVPFGSYYLYAGYETEFSKAYWLIPVKVESRKLISINLDNSNAREIWNKD